MGIGTMRLSLQQVAVYGRLGRISNLPTVWTNTVAGVVLAGGSLHEGGLPALLAAFTLFYTGGMFLNDAFDRDMIGDSARTGLSRAASSSRRPYSRWDTACCSSAL